MGHIHKDIYVRGGEAHRWLKVRALVDSGATFSLLPHGLARRAGLDPAKLNYKVRLANGKAVRVGGDLGLIRIDGREVPATILVGDADEPILGVETLETLGLAMNFRTGRLSPTRGYTIRLGGFR